MLRKINIWWFMKKHDDWVKYCKMTVYFCIKLLRIPGLESQQHNFRKKYVVCFSLHILCPSVNTKQQKSSMSCPRSLGTRVNLGIIDWGDAQVVSWNLFSTGATFLPWRAICHNNKLWHIYSMTSTLQNTVHAAVTNHNNEEAYAKKSILHPK